MQEIIDKEIDEMLRMGVIEHSEAPYASPLVLVKKPHETYKYFIRNNTPMVTTRTRHA